ncbi:MAG: PmoA family protein [Verrucomicrobiales bacterium]|nr:PmoA family protein [Verrucomicrobiales bacterium]
MRTRLTLPSLLSSLLLTLSATAKEAVPTWVIEVQAGAQARSQTVAVVACPPELAGASWIKPENGKRIPFQIDRQGRGWFIVDNLPAGSSRRYVVDLKRKASEKPRGCTLEFIGNALLYRLDGQPAFQFQQGLSPLPRPDIKPIFRRGGYLHPVFTPSGTLVTDDYPTNHVHHHGIWSAWTKTIFEGRQPDFWNMGEGKGTVIPLSLDGSWDGPVQAGFRARHRHQDLTITPRRTALEENWEGRLYALGGKKAGHFIFDLIQEQTCATGSPLELPEYHYGGMGLRGSEQWQGATRAFFLTSNGETNRVKGHATKANWCAMSGWVDGRLAGIAVLCHPQNFRAPQPMRIHPDEPFFCYAPPQEGAFRISPEQPYAARYRFVVFDGAPDAAKLEALWQDYVHPVEATLRQAKP